MPKETTFVDMIEKPGWKSLLRQTVKKEGMDPWNLDLIVLSEKYLKKIRAMKKNDFHVPANAVLASSILLRMKSDTWQIKKKQDKKETEEDLMDWKYFIEGERVPEIKARKRVTKRKVTVDELIDAVETVIEKQKKKARTKAKQEKKKEKIKKSFDTNQLHQIKELAKPLDELEEAVKNSLNGERITCFSNLLEEDTRLEVLKTFIPLLQLANDERVAIWQDEYFEEIFITLPEKQNN